MADWLHGYMRIGDLVHIKGMACCAGCGRPLGVAPILGIVVPDNIHPVAPPLPDWPFPQDDCPLCAMRKEDR
jgi:hypothetical protein